MFKIFENDVLRVCNKLMPMGFDLTENGTLCDTLEKITAYYKENNNRLLIWAGGSEKTIFSNPSINHHFRAWHDFYHVTKQLPFTYEGECEVMRLQQQDSSNPLSRILLECEVKGQFEYMQKHGVFPEDQKAFTLQWIRGEFP